MSKRNEPAGDIFHGDRARNYLRDRENTERWNLENAAMEKMLLDIPNGTSVLDVPFGTGRFLLLYLAKNMTVSGVDISPAMLEEARKHYGSAIEPCKLVAASGDNLPFPDDSFDYVASMRYIESIVPFAVGMASLREFHRVARKAIIVKLNNRIDGKELPPPAPDERMSSHFTRNGIVRLLASHGFEVENDILIGAGTPGKSEKRLYLARKV